MALRGIVKQNIEGEDILEDNNNNIIPFQAITGGKEPPMTGDDWLSKLSLGTVFYCKRKPNQGDPNPFVLLEYAKVGYTAKAVILNPVGSKDLVPVDPNSFSNSFRHFETLGILPTEEVEKEDEQGNSI